MYVQTTTRSQLRGQHLQFGEYLQNWRNLNLNLNSKKATPRATSAIWRIFAELEKPKLTLSKINLTSMEVSMF